jgi:hypothetical protein
VENTANEIPPVSEIEDEEESKCQYVSETGEYCK